MSTSQVPDDLTSYQTHYSEERFWKKLKKHTAKLGTQSLYAALLLFYALKSPKLSTKEKTIIIGTLGYFILPFDFIPDFLPGIGFTDDIAALSFALIKLGNAIDDDVRYQAKTKMREWLGNDVVDKLN
ncbi:MAG: YkvA family protein [Bacteroidales bacterium]|nr:YkvA family protein [Bacteroidales bacterium]